MKPRKPGMYQCRIPQKWDTVEVIRGKDGELRVVTKDGSEPLGGKGIGSFYGFEWREMARDDARQIRLEI